MINYEWQPIETAPKDGSRILAFFPLNSGYCRKKNMEIFMQVLIVGWDYYGWQLAPDGGTEFVYEITGEPTHWMSLPDSPK